MHHVCEQVDVTTRVNVTDLFFLQVVNHSWLKGSTVLLIPFYLLWM